MNIQPRIEKLSEKRLIGKKLKMSLGDNKTFELWKSFMPRLNEITNKKNNEMISLQVYNEPIILGNFKPALCIKTFYYKLKLLQNIPFHYFFKFNRSGATHKFQKVIFYCILSFHNEILMHNSGLKKKN